MRNDSILKHNNGSSLSRYLRTIHTRYLIASFLQSAAWYRKADQKELDQRDLVDREDSIKPILRKPQHL